MNPIIQTLNELNISQEKIAELFQTLTENPMMAMATIQGMGLAPEKIQSIMMMVMGNPELIKDAISELGLDLNKFEQAKKDLNGQQ